MTWISGLGVGALVVVLTACGGGDDSGTDEGGGDAFADGSAEDITAAALEDMTSASSLRMAGDVTNDGQSLSLDVAVTTEGDCEGTISVDGQGTTEILSHGEEHWFRPDEDFWRSFAGPQADQVIAMVGDKWVVMPPDEGGFAELCDLDNFLEELEEDPEDDRKVTKEGTETIDGQETVRLSGESEEGDEIQVWIATESPHHILQLEVAGGEEPGQLTFSDFDEDFGIEPPPADEVADLSQAG